MAVDEEIEFISTSFLKITNPESSRVACFGCLTDTLTIFYFYAIKNQAGIFEFRGLQCLFPYFPLELIKSNSRDLPDIL